MDILGLGVCSPPCVRCAVLPSKSVPVDIYKLPPPTISTESVAVSSSLGVALVVLAVIDVHCEKDSPKPHIRLRSTGVLFRLFKEVLEHSGPSSFRLVGPLLLVACGR